MKKIVEGAGKVPGIARQIASKLSREHGILNTLAKEHGEVSALLRLIHLERKRGAHASDEGVITRVRLLTTLSIELLAHSRAEEEVLYEALERSPEVQEQMKHSREEHGAMERLLLELLSIEYSSDRWLEAYEELLAKVQHHVDEEEDAVFAIAQERYSKKELKELDERFQERRAEVRVKLEGRSLSLEGMGRSEHHAG